MRPGASLQKTWGTVEERTLFRGGGRLSSSETPWRRYWLSGSGDLDRSPLPNTCGKLYTIRCMDTTHGQRRLRFADYYTSADLHPIFGRLLARQFCEMWEQMGRPAQFTIVEAGAGTGRLAEHILEFCRGFAGILRGAALCCGGTFTGTNRSTRERLAKFIREGKCSASIEIPVRIPSGVFFQTNCWMPWRFTA